MVKKKLYYYRIFDDKEDLNFFKSSLELKQIRKLLKKYENVHEKYFNPDFVEFLNEHDREAGLIVINNITY